MLKIDHETCNLCGLCQKSCPFGAISAGEETVAVDERCTLCGACVNVCPQAALSIERRQASPEELASYRGVYVCTECEERGKHLVPRRVVYELLTHGRRLADRLGQPLVAVALGDARMQDLERLCHQGAERVVCCRHDLLGSYSTDGFATALAAVVAKEKPSVLLFGATPNGRDLAPRVAARLRFGLTADCTGLEIDDQGQLVQTRPAFGGNIMASIISPYTRPQAATVRPNVFAAAAPDLLRPVAIEDFPVTLSKASSAPGGWRRSRRPRRAKRSRKRASSSPPGAVAGNLPTWTWCAAWRTGSAASWRGRAPSWSSAGSRIPSRSASPAPRSAPIFTSPSASAAPCSTSSA